MSKSNNGLVQKQSKKTESLVNGSLAIKSHASRLKVLTLGKGREDDGEMSAKTCSTFHSNNARAGHQKEFCGDQDV